MRLTGVQRQAASAAVRYGELGADLSSISRPQRPKHRTGNLNTTARLLRNSRLFSLPQPLPRPSLSTEGGVRHTFESETATLPYPTHAAVITPPSSLARGDWGLKRALPSKALSTSTPVIRIGKVDTIDHITDFESAADHVMTLQKWQEMSLPITTPKARSRFDVRRQPRAPSAFEDFNDPKGLAELPKATQEGAAKDEGGWGVGASTRSKDVRRWKYTAPWIAGMQPGEFERYLHNAIKDRRVEFRNWLREKLAAKRADPTSSASTNIDEGLGGPDEPEAQSFASKVLAEVVEEGGPVTANNTISQDILELRQHPRELFYYIWQFLDLPGRFPSQASDLNSWADNHVDVEQGPPMTHPSAGLSYLRPVAHLHNHPALGPMNQDPPVQARVLQRAGSMPGSSQIFGVGGVAVERPMNDLRDPQGNATTIRGLTHVGGPKIWAHAHEASIDSKGRIKMSITAAHEDTVDVWNPKPRGSQAGSGQGQAQIPGQQGGLQRVPDLTRGGGVQDYKKIKDAEGFDPSEFTQSGRPEEEKVFPQELKKGWDRRE